MTIGIPTPLYHHTFPYTSEEGRRNFKMNKVTTSPYAVQELPRQFRSGDKHGKKVRPSTTDTRNNVETPLFSEGHQKDREEKLELHFVQSEELTEKEESEHSSVIAVSHNLNES